MGSAAFGGCLRSAAGATGLSLSPCWLHERPVYILLAVSPAWLYGCVRSSDGTYAASLLKDQRTNAIKSQRLLKFTSATRDCCQQLFTGTSTGSRVLEVPIQVVLSWSCTQLQPATERAFKNTCTSRLHVPADPLLHVGEGHRRIIQVVPMEPGFVPMRPFIL